MDDGRTTTSPGASEAETLRLLRGLAAQVRDSAAGYSKAQEETTDAALKAEFGHLIDEREDMAEALDECLVGLGATPGSTGTVLGAAHRLFLDLRRAVGRRDREAILREIVRGESVLEEAYDAAIRAGLPPEIHNTVRRQHRLARRSRDRFRAAIPDWPGPDGRPLLPLTLASAATAVRRHPTAAATAAAALAAGFAAALWLTRPPPRR
ncbi:PA2169 family four-helix-bundle protein [Stella sp.]|uniref:PA2169 family four-helix-bundle protein n=1 Tax=Stella sp. TaxID=2912054 RepID=UPI0035B4AEC6